MNKKLKRSFLAAGIVVGVCALVWGGLTLLRNGSRSAVKVYPVTGISMTDYWGDTTETSGTVTMDKLQKVFLSQTQTSAQVYVTEGQTVKKGDRLLSYDSTLTELDVERARIACGCNRRTPARNSSGSSWRRIRRSSSSRRTP